jgi:hypothetical protein
MPDRPTDYRVPAGATPSPFPATPSLCRFDRPLALSSQVHSLVRRVLFGVCSPSFLRRPFGLRPALGFLPYSRCCRRSPRFAGLPISRCVPSSGFLNLSTVYSASGIAGLFHPATTSRVSVQGLGPAPQLYRLVAGLCLRALCVRMITGCPAATIAR